MKPEALSWIEQQKPDLVAAAEVYLEEHQIYKPGKRKDKPRISGSQLRNLLNAAQAESSLAVLINFLRYQVGRGNKGWPDRRSGSALEALLKDKVGGLAGNGAKAHEADRYGLEARLAALLLGYVIREYTFRCRQEGTSSS